MKLLLLEDNLKLNITIKKRLELKGYKVDNFTDGLEAFENIGNGYVCFILDINVPNLDGVELLKSIREYYDDIPVIIISATVELDIIKKAYGFGCNDYLKKPFFIDELEFKVDKLCHINIKLLHFGKNNFFDCKNSFVSLNNNEFRLTKKEKLLLSLFLDNKNKIITFENIENFVWQGDIVSLDSIRSLVRRVRKILKGDYISSIADTGYIFKT